MDKHNKYHFEGINMDQIRQKVSRIAYAISAMYGLYWFYVAVIAPNLNISNQSKNLIGYIVMYGLGLALLYRFTPDRHPFAKPSDKLSLSKIWHLSALICFGVTLLMFLSVFEFFVFKQIPVAPAFDFQDGFQLMILLLFSPWVEELVFRQWIGKQLLDQDESLYLFVSATFFSFVHIPVASLKMVIVMFYLGWILAWIYAKTRSLITVTIFHSGFNLIAGFLNQWVEQHLPPWVSVLYIVSINFIGLLGLIILLVQRRRCSSVEKPYNISFQSYKLLLTSPGSWLFFFLVAVALIGLKA